MRATLPSSPAPRPLAPSGGATTGPPATPAAARLRSPTRPRRPLKCGPPEVHPFVTTDGLELRLTRYAGGGKGPVVLCHGLGVSSGIFTLDTIETNLVEYLFACGYDIWLLDFRASIDLPASSARFDADVIAAIDYPEAVAEVRRLTGAASVQMVVHCFGSTVFFMSMLSGALQGVRSAVASQATPHVQAAGLVRLKAALRVPALLAALGIDRLTAYTDDEAGWMDRAFNRSLALYPLASHERCTSATCRRISFMYSLLYKHGQLAPATHDTLNELFGVAGMTTFGHLARMVRAGHLVDARGRDVYMPHVARLAIPLRLVHGGENDCFPPAGSERTLAWLRAHNDPRLYSRVVIPGFGHIDCIFGSQAATRVYPHIVEHLEQSA